MNQVLPLTTREVGSFLPTTRRCRRVGSVKWAQFTDNPPKLRKSQPTAAMLAGIRYEEKVHDALSGKGDYQLFKNPWFMFMQEGNPMVEYCQMDALLIYEEKVTIVEVKHTHCLEAWHQLYNLYLPVYAKAMRQADVDEKPIHVLEVCRWFDPMVRTPSKPKRVSSLDDTEEHKFNVMVIK